MFVKKKLRDLSEEEAKTLSNCNGIRGCKSCPLKGVTCEHSLSVWWFNNKDLYSDKFLDQEVQVEVPDLLTEEEKEYLQGILKAVNSKEKLIKIKKFDLLVLVFKDGNCLYLPYTKNLPFKFDGLKKIKEYTSEELGL